MPRYIDADWLYEKVENRYRVSSGIEHRCERDFLDLICEAPAADVVPRSEYDDLKLEYEGFEAGVKSIAKNIKAAVEREIVDEFMSAMRAKHEENRPKWGGALALLLPDIEQIATELKKKYTEGG